MVSSPRLAEILLIEDNEGDIELTRDALEEARFRNKLHVVEDGDKALDYLFKRNGYEDAVTPDLILLDLNLPKTDGGEILEQVRAAPSLCHIPVIILTSSSADRDIVKSYNLRANCYIVKPLDAYKMIDLLQCIENFWIDIVCLPTSTDAQHGQ